jgi:hypothetical protein
MHLTEGQFLHVEETMNKAKSSYTEQELEGQQFPDQKDRIYNQGKLE